VKLLGFFHWILIGQAIIVFAFVNDLRERFRWWRRNRRNPLGILLEIAAIGMRMGVYAVQPFPGKIAHLRKHRRLDRDVITGAIVGAIYKPPAARTP